MKEILDKLNYYEFITLRDVWVKQEGLVVSRKDCRTFGTFPISLSFNKIFYYKTGTVTDYMYREESSKDKIIDLLNNGYEFPYTIPFLTKEEQEVMEIINLTEQMRGKNRNAYYKPLKSWSYKDSLRRIYSVDPRKQISTRPFCLKTKSRKQPILYSTLGSLYKSVFGNSL